MTTFYKCRCFLTNNYFLKTYNVHVTFVDRQQVQRDFGTILSARGCSSTDKWEQVFEELENEFQRRNLLDEDAKMRREAIIKQYSRLHEEVYELREACFDPEFLSLVTECKKNKPTSSKLREWIHDLQPEKKLYRLPIFTEEFCNKLVEELINFEQSPCPKGRPNTMNNYGILLDELGMDEMVKDLRENYLAPICQHLFPDWTGRRGLDSHKAFVVIYKPGEDEALDYHFDNAEVTLNLCLGRNFTEGHLYFGDLNSIPTNASTCVLVENVPFRGILHRGRQLHGALPIFSGERYNLIIWMRSSSIRNTYCPMCGKSPSLMNGNGFADGFTGPI